MLKYLYEKEVFSEIPNEISLGISISGCRIRCHGCHSQELWEDIGTELSISNVIKLLQKHQGISCFLLMGGEHDIDTLIEIFKYVKYNYNIKTAWYCGLDNIPNDKKEIYTYLDYVKIGRYDERLGGLTSPKTNQRFYIVNHYATLKDITSSFVRT